MSLDNTYFEECEEEPEDKFTQSPNELVRDRSISSSCRMMIIFITSFKKPWRVNFADVLASFDEKIGKEKLYKLISEAIRAGYISRTTFIEKGLKRFKYKISKFPRFKICLPCTAKPHPAFRDPAEPDTLNNTLKKEYSSSSLRSEEVKREERGSEKKEPPAKQAVAPLSADATDLFSFFKEKILEKHPNIVPREKAWLEAIKGMLKADKRSVKEVKEVVSFALEDPFWVKQVQSPAGLRKEADRDGVQKYDKIYAQYVSKKQKANNVAFALWMCRRIPDKLRNLDLNDSETWIKDENRGVEISTEQDERLFREKFRTFVGRSYTEEELSWVN